MATKKKLLQAAAGTAAASGGAAGLNIEDVFSTYIYEGNGIGKRIENGINLGDGTEEETIIHLTGDSITDSGPNSISLTNTAVVSSSSIKKFGTASLYFDANSSSRLTATDPSLNLGGGDYTVEMWLYINDASGTKGIFAFSNPSDDTVYDIGMYHSSNGLTWQTRYTPVASVSNLSSGSNTISNSTWHHVALVRYNDYHYMYIDGVSQGTPVDVTGLATGWNHLKLGTHWTDQYCFTGRIDEFRVTRKALYTANFTPPTAAFSTSYTSTTGEGGLVWIKNRTVGNWNILFDTERGTEKVLHTNETDGQGNRSDTLTSFNASGFTLGAGGTGNANSVNATSSDYASWTFRKAPKFFTMVQWSGNSTMGRTISHDLGTDVGFILIKAVDKNDAWYALHKDSNLLILNQTTAEYSDATTADYFGDGTNIVRPTSTDFTIGSDAGINGTGYNYIAYLFAHNNGDGGFGPDGDADIIKCGSYTGNGSTDGPEIDLGFEPQWLMVKRTDSAPNGDEWWFIGDNMRGVPTGGNTALVGANTSSAEFAVTPIFDFTATGFKITGSGANYNASGGTYIYIAIRRGPMAVPTDATDVFAIDQGINASAGDFVFNAGFPVDLMIRTDPTTTYNRLTIDRLRGNGAYIITNGTDAEADTAYGGELDHMEGVFTDTAFDFSNHYAYMWKRARGYFDVVAYTGNGTAGRTVSHNLGVAPEMMWVKARDFARGWNVYHKDLTASGGQEPFMELNATDAVNHDSSRYPSAPTATDFVLGNNEEVNSGNYNYIAYLFASLDGVSKVGSYTGNGTGQNIDCGFSNGARFVLIKRTSGADSWFLWDSVRGIVSGNDPYLRLNLTAAETTTTDRVDPYSGGFAVTGSDDGNNKNGDTYIFYAIA